LTSAAPGNNALPTPPGHAPVDWADRAAPAGDRHEPGTPGPRHRPIRSFVLREGRLTPAQARAFVDLWPRLGVDWYPGTLLDPQVLFADDLRPGNPVYLEIGFGDGETLARMAQAHPERRYLGVEVHRPGVGHLLLELERLGLSNVRVLRQDAVELLTQGLPPASLHGVYLFFPDPWPKQRHHKRRILSTEFVALLARAIRPGGVFHAATDWAPYAEQMLRVLNRAGDSFANTNAAGGYSPRPEDRPLTKFERRGQRLGHDVHDLVFRRR
jgi:tRNA (guanine-N7-)-methyltransferase